MATDLELAQIALRVRQGLNEIAARAAQKLHPEYGECFWVSGPASAAFAGDSSPLTQACGVGFAPEGIAERLAGVSDFYGSRSQRWELIVTPYEPPETANLAIERGLRLDHYETVLMRDLSAPIHDPPLPANLSIEALDRGQFSAWSDAAVEVFFGKKPPAFAEGLMEVLNGTPADRYSGVADGKIVAVGSSATFEDAVFLGGMGTLEAYRGKGFQSAMIARRLIDARAKGARWAMLETAPGSGSQRNAMKAGFHVAYTTAVWMFELS